MLNLLANAMTAAPITKARNTSTIGKPFTLDLNVESDSKRQLLEQATTISKIYQLTFSSKRGKARPDYDPQSHAEPLNET